MIEKMKKYDFLIYHKDYQLFLYKLRELGVVHVVQKQIGSLSENKSLSAWVEMDKRFLDVIKELKKINNDNKKVEKLTPLKTKENVIETIEQVEKFLKDKEELTFDKLGYVKEIERITPFGSFSPQNIERLKERGYHINFYAVTESRFDSQWIESYNAIIVNQIGTQLYFITFTQEENLSIEAEHIRLSEKSLEEWINQVLITDKKIKNIDTELAVIAKNELETICYHEKRVKDHINFEKIELSGDAKAAEKLILLAGFIPLPLEKSVTAALQKESIYFQVSEPSPEENPPILLKNNRFAKSFEMIADLFDKPNYNAFDFTPFFAPFYVIFFGLCLGDAGYGLLILLASFFLNKKSNADFLRSAGRLATWLGIGTTIFGFISGTFFGIELLKQTWPWIQPFKNIMLDSNQLFTLALICGGIQITYAWIIKIITTSMRFGFVYALDTFGWMIAILGIGFAFFMDSAGTITPELMKTICIVCGSVGGFMMLFFNNPKKGLKGIPGSIGSGLYGIYTKVTNLLGDMLSYIRLFALGISGAVMGMVFNQLAVGFAPDIIIVKQLVILVIVLFGHGINIFLNGLGAFIHPMRLTFVEFYNNVGFEGGGKAYTPFKRE